MERCDHKHLYNYIIHNNILTLFPSEFISGGSTTNRLFYNYHHNVKLWITIQGKIKAFGRIWHKCLLFNLAVIGCFETLLRWFTNYRYLSGRRQRVVINGMVSDWATIFAGVLQGCIT